MKKQWCCVSCLAEMELDTHGRCSACGSDAVARIGRGAFVMTELATNGASIMAAPAVSRGSAGVDWRRITSFGVR